MSFGEKLRTPLGSITGYKTLKDRLEETQGDLGLTQSKVDELQKELKDANKEFYNLGCDYLRLMGELNEAKNKRDAYKAALNAFCPEIKTGKDMKRLYDCAAPFLDKEGFHLYFAAKDLLGTYCDELFPYEDARGMFEEADGHMRLRYLIAYHFNAVEWKIVPGTCYEEASLLPVDTSAPEFQAFERKLYESVLRSLGFQHLLWKQDAQTQKKRKGDDVR